MLPNPNLTRISAGISAVIPALNEAALIESTVRHMAEVLEWQTPNFEIVVVNDGSLDETGNVLSRLQAQAPEMNLIVVTHSENRGYGAALASGFDAASKALIFMTDGDEQFNLVELALLIDALHEDTDMAIGWRHKRADPLVRRLNSWGWNALVRLFFGYTARDVDCAFKLFRRDVWERLAVHARGATFSAELLIKARRGGFRIRELPVSHFPRTAGRPTGARLDVIARAFQELLALRWSLGSELRDQKPREARDTDMPTQNHISRAA